VHIDPAITILVSVVLGILAIGLASKLMKQPSVVGYLLAGVLLGPSGFEVVSDRGLLERMGEFGVLLLLFFVGMEVTPKKLVASWRIAVIGTLGQIVLSIAVVALISPLFGWTLPQCLLFGFVISLSSTAVVIKMLEDRGLMRRRFGQNVLGILLAQDLAIIPMMMILSTLSGEDAGTGQIAGQIIGGALLLGLLGFVLYRGEIHLPFARRIEGDHELQVFAALGLCFGLAAVTGLFHLSGALGAFAAGILVAAARETDWVKDSLESMRALFLGFFFVSIGMLIDLQFVLTHWLEVLLVVIGAFLTNGVINAVILRVGGYNWKQAAYGSSYLAQIGEFSFVLAAIGYSAGIVDSDGYDLIIVVIALSLLISPLTIGLAGRRLKSAANDLSAA